MYQSATRLGVKMSSLRNTSKHAHASTFCTVVRLDAPRFCTVARLDAPRGCTVARLDAPSFCTVARLARYLTAR